MNCPNRQCCGVLQDIQCTGVRTSPAHSEGPRLVTQAGHGSLVIVAHAVLHDAERCDQHGHAKRDTHGRDHKEISHDHLGSDDWAPALQVLLREAPMEVRPFVLRAASLFLAAEQAHASGNKPVPTFCGSYILEAHRCISHSTSRTALSHTQVGQASASSSEPPCCLRAWCEGFWPNRVQLQAFQKHILQMKRRRSEAQLADPRSAMAAARKGPEPGGGAVNVQVILRCRYGAAPVHDATPHAQPRCLQPTRHTWHRAQPAPVVTRLAACFALRRPCNKEEVATRAPQVISVNEAAREVTLYQSVGSKQLGRSFHFDKVRRALQPCGVADTKVSNAHLPQPVELEHLLSCLATRRCTDANPHPGSVTLDVSGSGVCAGVWAGEAVHAGDRTDSGRGAGGLQLHHLCVRALRSCLCFAAQTMMLPYPCLQTDRLQSEEKCPAESCHVAQVWADGNGQDVYDGGAPPHQSHLGQSQAAGGAPRSSLLPNLASCSEGACREYAGRRRQQRGLAQQWAVRPDCTAR